MRLNWLLEEEDPSSIDRCATIRGVLPVCGNWKASVTEQVRRYFTDIFSAFENWHNEIFNYCDYKFTNAFTEALNNGIRAVYSSGYGYSFEVLRAKLL